MVFGCPFPRFAMFEKLTSLMDLPEAGLFLFMTVLSQSFLAFVSCHLMAFSFFSAWHSSILFIKIMLCRADQRNMIWGIYPGLISPDRGIRERV